METLRDISAQLNALVEEYNDIDTTDERREELDTMLSSLDITFEDKIESLATLRQAYIDKSESLEKEISRLSDWSKRCESKADWLKNYIASCMNIARQDKVETGLYKFSFRKSEQVIVQPDAEIAKDFCTYKPESWTPDKAKLKKAIQSGEEIVGVEIITNKNLQIK